MIAAVAGGGAGSAGKAMARQHGRTLGAATTLAGRKKPWEDRVLPDHVRFRQARRAHRRPRRRGPPRALRAARRPRRAPGRGARARARAAGAHRRRGRDRQDDAACGRSASGSASVRVLLGRVRRAVHAAPARAVRWTSPRRPAASSARSCRGGAAGACSSRRSAGELGRRAAERRGARGPALGRRGHAGRPAPARPSHRVGPGAGPGDLPRRRARPHPSAADRARRAPAPARSTGSRWRRSRPAAVAALAGPDGRRPARAAPPDRRQPVLRHRGARDGRRRDPRHGARRGAGPRRAADDGARALLDAVAIIPQRAELWLLEALADGDAGALEACLASGILRADRDAVALPPRDRAASRSRRRCRRTGGWRCIAGRSRRSPPPARRPDPARLAHHAEAADDAEAVLRHAPGRRRGGGRARRRTARRRPSSPARCATPTACRPSARAELLERRSYECYLTNDFAGAIEARRARARRAPRGRRPARRGRRAPLALAPDLVLRRQRDRRGRGAPGGGAARVARRPVASWPWPTATWRSCGCSPNDQPGATRWGERAIELAERLGETEIVVHALNNVGRRGAASRRCRGGAGQARAQPRAGARGRPRGARRPRVHQPRRRVACERATTRSADRHLDAGIAYCAEHDLDVWRLYMTGWRARSRARAGRWDDAPRARRRARAPERRRAEPHHPAHRRRPPARAPRRPRCVGAAGRGARARARRPASCSGSRRWPPPAAEARWLAGRDARRSTAETAAALALALERRDALGRRRADLLAPARRARRTTSRSTPSPSRSGSSSRATAAAAARAWAALGCPYEAALALRPRRRRRPRSGAASPSCSASARGRPRAASRAPCASAGVRDVRRGPAGRDAREPGRADRARARGARAAWPRGCATPRSPRGCSSREKTVAHHVSAILRKLGVATRSQAGAEAARLGIVER